ncbi:MAG TPA: GMC family oxidoreductase [Actinomycetota bacterium]
MAGFRLSRRVRRVLVRLAPWVCPPEVAELGLVEPVVDHVELSLGSFPAGLRLALVGVVRALGATALVGRRSPGEQFVRWFSARSRLRRTAARGIKALFALAFYEQPGVRERMGYRPDDWIARASARRLQLYSPDIRQHQRDLIRPDPLVVASPVRPPPGIRAGGISSATEWRAPSGRRPVEMDCDVVVVGSGAGGAVVAAELAEAGLDVVVLEEGGHHVTEEFTTDSSAMVRMMYRDGGAAFARGTPPVQFAEGRCVGGSTVVNGAMSWRTPERVLERWVRDEGVEGASPQEMDRFFARVERFLSVAPQDPGSIGRDNELLREGAERMGWRVAGNRRAQVHCAGCNVCTYGCPTGAKQSALVSYLPRAAHFGARIHADARVERVLFDRGRAAGVSGRVVEREGGRGSPFTVRARATFVCAGAIQTPILLTRSGVRSASGRLGRNLSLHPNARVVAFFDEDVLGFQGAHQAYQVREFEDQGLIMAAVNLPPGLLAASLPQYGRAMGETMEDYDRIVTAGVLVEDTSTGRVRPRGGGAAVTYALNDADAAIIVRGVALLSEALFAAGARRVLLPFEGVPDLVRPDDARALQERRIPKASMELFTVHMMGTAAMGGDPARHVCDPHGRVFGAEGLLVSDASLFPTPVGVNPMETIMALATRNAERFLETGA